MRLNEPVTHSSVNFHSSVKRSGVDTQEGFSEMQLHNDGAASGEEISLTC